MNHLCARQRTADERWDYTYNGVPYGYCREYKPISEDVKWLSADQIKAENEKMEKLKSNFHADGHATKEDACACYKKYLLDTSLRLVEKEPENASQQNRCQVCKKFTACHASVGAYRMFTLCPEHQTRECVESLLSVGESWES